MLEASKKETTGDLRVINRENVRMRIAPSSLPRGEKKAVHSNLL